MLKPEPKAEKPAVKKPTVEERLAAIEKAVGIRDPEPEPEPEAE